MVESRRPNILITTDFAAPHRNGVAQVVQHITDALREYDITVLTYGLPGEVPREVHGHVTTVRIRARRLLGDTLRVPARLPKLPKHDLVITNTRFFTLSAVGMRLASKWKVPRIHLEHGNRHVPHHNPLVRVAAWSYDHSIGRAVITQADLVVCIARIGLPFVRKLGAKKVALIPNGIDTKPFAIPASRGALIRQELGFAPTDRVVLFVGRLVREKGVQDLLTALASLPGSADWVLLAIGSGPAKKKLEAQAKKLGVRAVFLGELQPAHLPPYYRAADLFVNPSWAEGLPMTVLEAAASGTPILATAVGGTAELLPAESLIRPRNKNALRAALARSSSLPRSRFPPRFSLQAMHASWRSLVQTFVPVEQVRGATSASAPKRKPAGVPAPRTKKTNSSRRARR